MLCSVLWIMHLRPRTDILENENENEKSREMEMVDVAGEDGMVGLSIA